MELGAAGNTTNMEFIYAEIPKRWSENLANDYNL